MDRFIEIPKASIDERLLRNAEACRLYRKQLEYEAHQNFGQQRNGSTELFSVDFESVADILCNLYYDTGNE